MKKFEVRTLFRCAFLLIMLCAIAASCGPREPAKLYLNIIWHQHQPSYLDATKDQLMGPWVRTHSTKDYYDMAAILEKYPKVHLTIDLTSVLLRQLQEYYIKRLGPYVDTKTSRVDARGFLAEWGGKTDPWIDLALKDTRQFDQQDLDYLFNRSGKQAWCCFSLTEQIIRRFPQYRALLPQGRSVGSIQGDKPWESYTLQQKRRIKFFFFLALFDPSFLKGVVTLPEKNPDDSPMMVDLSDLVLYDAAGSPSDDSDDSFTLTRDVTEEDCNRLVAEAYKVMANVIPIHKKLMYDPKTRQGQIEIVTTPFYHPILPLIYDSDIAKKCQPQDPLPPRYTYPMDAENQVRKGVTMFERIFGEPPNGMWPAEGAVAEEVVPLFLKSGIRWIATGPHVLAKSLGKDSPDDLSMEELARMYCVDDGKSWGKLAIVFRDLALSDEIAFDYPKRTEEENVKNFFQAVEAYLPPDGGGDRLLTVLLDGENAWEHFDKDNDGTKFLNLLYAELEERFDQGLIVTVTPSEYIDGNPKRGVRPHPIEKAKKIDPLYPASWFLPDFSNWIGETEENSAWELLLQTRSDLQRSGLTPPDPTAMEPEEINSRAWYIYQAWEEMYAAEGSDWFWWYGEDETAAGGDFVFDENFRLHLTSVYRYANLAGAHIQAPEFKPIISH